MARLLSNRLGLPILDTGAMYRALAVAAARAKLSTDEETALAELAETVEISFGGEAQRAVFLNGEDVSAEIRTLAMGQAASLISVHPAVRQSLVRRQKKMLESGGYVLEGRDTTTVVAPDADLKLFLTASIEERARRRWLEATSKGEDVSLQRVVVDVVERDHRDYSRKDSPLQLGEDVILLETFGSSPPEVVERVMRLLEDRQLVPTWLTE